MDEYNYIVIKNRLHHTIKYLTDPYKVAVFLLGKNPKEWKVYRLVPIDGPTSLTEIERHLTAQQENNE